MQKVQDPVHLFVCVGGVFADQSLTYAARWDLHFDDEDSKTQGWEIETSVHTAGKQWSCV